MQVSAKFICKICTAFTDAAAAPDFLPFLKRLMSEAFFPPINKKPTTNNGIPPNMTSELYCLS